MAGLLFVLLLILGGAAPASTLVSNPFLEVF
jgi:hypothetical protein